jgi:hypothetical protein
MTKKQAGLRTPGFTAERSSDKSLGTYLQHLRDGQSSGVYPAYNEFDCKADCERMGMTKAFTRCACFGICAMR